MDIFTIILLILCIVFAIYKLVFRLFHHFNNLSKKSTDIEMVNSKIDMHTHSTVSFDFPNIQSETDMEIINSGSDLCEKQEKIVVKEYCKF